MDTLNKYFWALVIIILFVIGWKVVPIYYNYVSIRTICQEQADQYHKYGKQFTNSRLEEHLVKQGIPKNKRSYSISVTDDGVFINIHYEDIANFFDKYKKKFVFDYTCEGPLESVY